MIFPLKLLAHLKYNISKTSVSTVHIQRLLLIVSGQCYWFRNLLKIHVLNPIATLRIVCKCCKCVLPLETMHYIQPKICHVHCFALSFLSIECIFPKNASEMWWMDVNKHVYPVWIFPQFISFLRWIIRLCSKYVSCVLMHLCEMMNINFASNYPNLNERMCMNYDKCLHLMVQKKIEFKIQNSNLKLMLRLRNFAILIH